MSIGIIARDGIKYFILFLLTGIILFGMFYKTALFKFQIIPVLGLVFTFLSFFSLYFFRNPKRTRIYEENEIISPADGKVVKIDDIDDKDIGTSTKRVCIFMNIFNVHINRNPINGKVVEIKYSPGRFLNAADNRASSENERNSIVIEKNDKKKIRVVQIAGLIARRIRCFIKKDDNIFQGDYLGLIQFGSRLDVYMPKNTIVKVEVGDKVKAGIDTIGVFDE